MNSPVRDALRSIALQQPLVEGINRTDIPSVRIFKSSAVTHALKNVYDPSLFVVVQGAKIVVVGNRTIAYDESRYLVSSSFLPVSGSIVRASEAEPFLSFQITFSTEQIFEAMDDFAVVPTKTKTAALAMASSPYTEELLDAVHRLARLLYAPEDIAILEKMYLKEILYRLLVTEENPALRQLAFIEGNAYRISKAIAYINANLYARLNIDDLAAYAKMSVSAFHKHFKTVTQVSPLQYIKIQRLQNAKRLMVSENMDVSGASFHVGYQSVSQFSREYSNYFGMSPSEDIKRFRQTWSAAF